MFLYFKMLFDIFVSYFPITFPYMVVGPEYFFRREDSRRNVKIDALGPYYKHFGVKQLPSCPWVSSGCWTRGVVQRIESQIQADWVTIPALRNVQFRSHIPFLLFFFVGCFQLFCRPHLRFVKSRRSPSDSFYISAKSFFVLISIDSILSFVLTIEFFPLHDAYPANEKYV